MRVAKSHCIGREPNSLPKRYSTLVTALEARGDNLSLSYVQQALIHEEQKVRESSCPSDGVQEDQKALVVNKLK